MNLSRLSLVVLIALSVAVCGHAQTSPAAAPAAAPVPAGRVIEITANDMMKFSVTEIVAAPGETLTIKLNNIGSLPKNAMGHNLIVLKSGVNAQAYAMAAMQAAKTDYEPAALADQVLAATKLLGPKESDTATFTVPETPGSLVFLCSFPAHFMAGMKGVITVK